MTDPIPDEAVEAAARELYIAEHAQHPGAAQTWDDGYKAQEDWMLVWFARALVALTAAAPHIAAQAKAMPAENLQIINGWLVERGAHDLDYPAGAAYGPYPDSDAEPLVKLDELPGWPGDAADLRAGIEALRDEIAAASPRYAGVVDRLDALLRGA